MVHIARPAWHTGIRQRTVVHGGIVSLVARATPAWHTGIRQRIVGTVGTMHGGGIVSIVAPRSIGRGITGHAHGPWSNSLLTSQCRCECILFYIRVRSTGTLSHHIACVVVFAV